MESPFSELRNFEFHTNQVNQEDSTISLFLPQARLFDLENLKFICSSTSENFTALLYSNGPRNRLFLFVLKNEVNEISGDIRFKEVRRMKFKVEKMGIENNSDKGNIKIFLVNRNFIVMEYKDNKLFLIDFSVPRYLLLFSLSNSSHSTSLQVLSTFDERLSVAKIKGGVAQQIRTYVFVLYGKNVHFFIIGEDAFEKKAGRSRKLIRVPGVGIDNNIMNNDNKMNVDSNLNNDMNNNCDINEPVCGFEVIKLGGGDKGFFFIIILLMEGRMERYITPWVRLSLKDIFLNFEQNVNLGTIKKCVNKIEKDNNCKLYVHRDYSSTSFILLKINKYVISFRFYENDTPMSIRNRFCIYENTIVNKSIGNNDSDNNEEAFNFSNAQSKYQSKVQSKQDIILSSRKDLYLNASNYSIQSNGLYFDNKYNMNYTSVDSSSPTKKNIDSNSSVHHVKFDRRNSSQIFNESFTNKLGNNKQYSLKQSFQSCEFNLNLNNINNSNVKNDTLQTIVNNSQRNDSEMHNHIGNYTLTTTYDKHIDNKDEVVNLIKTQEKDIIVYNLAFDKQQDTSNIKFGFSFIHFFHFKMFNKIMYFWRYPIRYKDISRNSKKDSLFPENFEESKVFYQQQFEGNGVLIYDVLHYNNVKFNFLLTNKFILKIRIHHSIYSLLGKCLSGRKESVSSKDSPLAILKRMFKYRKVAEEEQQNCRLCEKPYANIICEKCQNVYYCSEDHKEFFYRNFHFFECQLIQLFNYFEKYQKFSSYEFNLINKVIKSFLVCLNEIFKNTHTKKDCSSYSIFFRIMLDIFSVLKIEDFLIEHLNGLRTILVLDPNYVCKKIFMLETFMFYCNLHTLYINFLMNSEMYTNAIIQFNDARIIEMFTKKETRNLSMFTLFGFNNDILKYELNEIGGYITKYSKNYFFNLVDIYKVEHENCKSYLKIHEQFIEHYIYALSNLLKTGFKLSSMKKKLKILMPLELNQILSYIPCLFEEKYGSVKSINDYTEIPTKKHLILCYHYLSFLLIKINKPCNAILVNKFILKAIKNLKTIIHKDKSLDFLNAKICLNNGILMYYIGHYQDAIHKLEEGYRICFEKKLNIHLKFYIMKILCLAYLNICKLDSAYILIRQLISEYKSIFGNNICLSNRNKKENKEFLIKLKIYLLYIFEFLSYKFSLKKMNDKNMNKTVENALINSSKSKKFNIISPGLINYVTDGNIYSNAKTKQQQVNELIMNQKKNKNQLNQEQNMDKIIFDKDPNEALNALEFFYDLSPAQFEILNNDNGSIIVEEEIREEVPSKKSSSLSKDFSQSYNNNNNIVKQGYMLSVKDEQYIFMDEIDIKMTLFDRLTPKKQIQLKTIGDYLLKRSFILRDSKGQIDKFNLNYHPFFSEDFFKLIGKIRQPVSSKNREKIKKGKQNNLLDFDTGNIIFGLRGYVSEIINDYEKNGDYV